MVSVTESSEGPPSVGHTTSILALELDSLSDVATSSEPACFADLLLDQVIASVVKGREEYDLLPYYYAHLSSPDAIALRHEVWRDLEDAALTNCLALFGRQMREVRQRLNWSAKVTYVQHRRGLFLDAVRRYGDAVGGLAAELAEFSITSRGLTRFRALLNTYVGSTGFSELRDETAALVAQLSEIRYCLNIKGPRIRVLKYHGESDYGAEIEETFQRFQQGAVNDYRLKFSDWPEINHVESFIADRVALLFPHEFSALEQFCEHHRHFLDATVARFEREIQFYLAYLEYLRPLKGRGLPFCLPDVVATKAVFAVDTFDIALASKLAAQASTVVVNDFHLDGAERVLVVSGPNQGGKTTFARAFGQLHYLAGLGCPVPGRRAQLLLYDQLFTHFGKEEDATYQRGKLEDDLVRIQDVLANATTDSIVIMNEIFSSTTTQDALALGTKVLERIIELDLLCVVVSFIDELTLLSPTIVSMTSQVNPVNPFERTFKVIRHPDDGLAYAIAIAQKYGLTYETLRKRIS